jgi:para-nitrobenzyl esterase
MTDLLAALAWVRREIAAFGGAADRITLAGQSAGASLVSALLATEPGRDVDAAIAFSVGGPVLEPAETVDVAARVLARLGLHRTDVAALREVPAQAVAEAAAAVARSSRRQRLGGVVFGAALDGRLVPAQPIDVLASGALRDTALWFGSCRDEMTMFLQGGSDDAAAVARARIGDAAFEDLLAVYRDTARHGEDPLQALLTDEMWVRPTWEMAEAQAAAGGRAWLSRFDHAPALPPFDVLGPTHGADNACLWADPPRFVERPLLGRPGGPMGEEDLTVTAALLDSVLGVVRDGSPATGVLADWQPYEPVDRCTALFDARPVLRSDPDSDRHRAWMSVAG